MCICREKISNGPIFIVSTNCDCTVHNRHEEYVHLRKLNSTKWLRSPTCICENKPLETFSTIHYLMHTQIKNMGTHTHTHTEFSRSHSFQQRYLVWWLFWEKRRTFERQNDVYEPDQSEAKGRRWRDCGLIRGRKGGRGRERERERERETVLPVSHLEEVH